VPESAVVEDLEVLEDRVGELEPVAPTLPVEQLGLHPAPDAFDHRVVVAVPDRPHEGHQTGGACPFGEGPGCKLDAVVGVNDQARVDADGPVRSLHPRADRHPEVMSAQVVRIVLGDRLA
jgi:hypothetical protein